MPQSKTAETQTTDSHNTIKINYSSVFLSMIIAKLERTLRTTPQKGHNTKPTLLMCTHNWSNNKQWVNNNIITTLERTNRIHFRRELTPQGRVEMISLSRSRIWLNQRLSVGAFMASWRGHFIYIYIVTLSCHTWHFFSGAQERSWKRKIVKERSISLR